MKRVLAVVLCVLLLTGCSESTSIGIIGGADGPTSIFVGEEVTAQGVKLIRADGDLYYDTGVDSSLIPRCGTLDGALKANGMEFEVPQKDGESNFETSGYQSVTGMTKEVPMDGRWRIFKRFPESKTDFGKFKYVLKLRGWHPNAARASEYIVLTNDLTIDFDMVSKSIFSSNSNDWLDCYVLPVVLDEGWGVSMWAEDVKPTGATIVFEQFEGNAEGELQTGEWLELEVMNEDNEWEKVATNPLIDYAFNSVAYMIKKNDRTEMEASWEWLYGKLPAGYYRIAKKVMDFKAPGDFEEEVYYAEFYIE